MASPATCDLEALLAPISETAPTGVDIRQDEKLSTAYYDLKAAVRTARRTEAAADSGTEVVMPAEWDTILTRVPEVLTTQSKDLELASWYIEALLRRHGFAGLRDGFLLAAGIIDRYWDSFHSLPPDEGGLVTRLAPLEGLNGSEADGTLLQPVRKAPITDLGDTGAYSFYNYEQAVSLSQVTDPVARERRIERGDVSMEKFTALVNQSGGKFYVGLIEDLAGAHDAFKAMTASLEAKAGADAPPSSKISELLGTILQTVTVFSKDLVAAVRPAEAPSDAAAAPAEGGAAAPAAAGGSGPVRTREDALRQLLQLADYFKSTEPQSPLSAILEEAVRRARLSFADLLAELLPDPAAWRGALTNVGIKPPPEG